MTPDFLEKYDCTLTVKSPVFIGSGKKLSKAEYIYEPSTKTLRVIDVRRLYEFMEAKGKTKDLEDYFRNPNSYNGTLMFLISKQIKRADFENFIDYSLDDCELPKGSGGRGKPVKYDILEFMSDPYGNPYVPGSTIKGMLRTAIAASRIRSDKVLWDKTASILGQSSGSGRKYLAKEIVRAEADIFNTLKYENQKHEDAVNCDMRLIKVGDSEPLSKENLIICQKYDERPDGSANVLPIFKICLKPDTQIKFTVTIERSGCENSIGKQIYRFEDIIRALKDFDRIYVDSFLNKFKSQVKATDETRCWLGSAGFHTKTILAAVYSDEETLLNETKEVFRNILDEDTFKKHEHNLEGMGSQYKYHVSPHMRKKTLCGAYDFGETILTFSKKAI